MKNSQDRAYAFLKEKIINLSIKPGHRIRAQEIAKKIKASRTPVREALSRLEQEGLVIRDGGWGYLVRPITLKEISDLFRLRESLEVQAALEALPNLNEETFADMEALLQSGTSLLSQQKLEDFRAANREFHLMIAAASGNDLLYRILRMLDDRIRVVGALHLDRRKDRAREVLIENAAILQALRQGNPTHVTEVVLAHVHNSRVGLLPMV